MAMMVGEVTVDEDGEATGNGLAFAIYQSIAANIDEDNLPSVAEAIAPFCEALASSIVTHIRDNAEVTVTVVPADDGLQRTPNPNNPDTDTQGPSANVELATKGTVE